MQATIEIDLGPLAEEWEAVAWRLPNRGDYWLSHGGALMRDDGTSGLPCCFHLIVRRKWTWPSWLKARWYAEDADGSQWAFMQEPSLRSDGWGWSDCATEIGKVCDITKIGGDWKQSLRENPNWKASQE